MFALLMWLSPSLPAVPTSGSGLLPLFIVRECSLLVAGPLVLWVVLRIHRIVEAQSAPV